MVQIEYAAGVVDVPKTPVVATRVSLASTPNPVATRGTLHFTLPAAGVVSLSLHDASGRRVAHLLDRSQLPAGAHRAVLDAHGLSSGIYFARLEVDARVAATRKVLVLR